MRFDVNFEWNDIDELISKLSENPEFRKFYEDPEVKDAFRDPEFIRMLTDGELSAIEFD